MRRCVTDSDTKNDKKLQTNDNNDRQLRILIIRMGATPIRMSAIASKSIKNGLSTLQCLLYWLLFFRIITGIAINLSALGIRLALWSFL